MPAGHYDPQTLRGNDSAANLLKSVQAQVIVIALQYVQCTCTMYLNIVQSIKIKVQLRDINIQNLRYITCTCMAKT